MKHDSGAGEQSAEIGQRRTRRDGGGDVLVLAAVDTDDDQVSKSLPSMLRCKFGRFQQ